MKKQQLDKFINYFSKQLTPDQISYLNNINNITIEEVDLFRDIIISLAHIIHKTYLGDDVIDDIELFEEHYRWCWSENINRFELEGLSFKKPHQPSEYLFNYFLDVYYSNPNKTDLLFEHIINFWLNIFTLSVSKTKSEYDIFNEMYQNLKKYHINNLIIS